MMADRKPNPEPILTLLQVQRMFERSGGKTSYVVDGDARQIEMIRDEEHFASIECAF